MHYSVGQKIGGRFEVHRIYGGVGKSGMGVVYICVDQEEGGALALKTFQEGFLHDKQLEDHFKRGALAWIQLDRHPAIVRAHGVMKMADQLFLGLEYIAPDDADRNNLGHHLQGRVSLENSLRWSLQFCDAMEHARVRGVTPHRDIKPDNLMITREGNLKVSDYDLSGRWDGTAAPPGIGAAAAVSAGTPGLTFVQNDVQGFAGTLPWMAPEQFQGKTSVQSDIYSFGVVLYQLANEGQLPIRPGEDGNWHQAHQHQVPEALSSPLWPIIERCLAKRAADRFGAADEARGFHELKAALVALWQAQLPGREMPALANGRALDVEDHNGRGVSLSYLGLHDQALRAYKKALELQPNDATVYLNVGVAFAGKGNLPQAEKAYRKAVHLQDGMAEGWNNLGLVCKMNGRLVEAEQAYRKALALDADMQGAYENLSVLLSEQQRHEEAVGLITEAVRRDPINAQYHNSMGVSLEKAGRYEEALNSYLEATRLRPRDAAYQYALGNGWRFMGDMNKAVEAWTLAAELDPRHSMARFNLGIAYEHAGDRVSAYNHYSAAIEADPSNPNPYFNFGLLLANAGLFGEGADAFEKFVENITPELSAHEDKARDYVVKMRADEELNRQQREQYVEAVYNRGLAYLNLHRLDEARDWLEQALRQRPDYPNALCGMGIYHEKNNDYARAVACYQESIEADPGYYIAFNNLGWANYNLGNYPVAIQAYEKYLSLAPVDEQPWVGDAQKLIAQMRDSGVDEPAGMEFTLEPVDAPPQAESGAEAEPQAAPSDALMAEAWALFGQANYDAAKLVLEMGMPLDPGNARMVNMYGRVLEAMGDMNGAIVKYLDATELEPRLYEAQQNLGLAFAAEGDLDAAQDHFEFLMRDFSEVPEAGYNFGSILLQRGRYKEAAAALRRSIELRADFGPTWYNLGLSLVQLRRDGEAVEAFEQALELQAGHAMALYNLAAAQTRRGQHPEAIAAYKAFLEQAPAGCEQELAQARKALRALDR